MNSTNCDRIQTELLDYLEEELSAEDRERVADHLAECHNCKKEYKGLRAMLNKAKNLTIEDPGEDFWQQLPHKVLAQVKQERQARRNSPNQDVSNYNASKHKVVDFFGTRHSNGTAAKPTRLNDSSDFAAHRLTASLAIAAILLLVVNVLLFSPKSGYLWFDQTQFQVRIDSNNLPTVALSVAQDFVPGGESARLGFVEQQRVAKAFTVGWLLSESFVYILGNRQQLTLQRLRGLQQYLQNQSISAVTLSSLRKSVDMLQSTQESPELAAELLHRFQHDYENYLTHTAPHQIELYRAGIWVFNASLAVAAKDVSTIERMGKAPQLEYLQQAFTRINAPAGIRNSLQKFAVIAKGLSDRQSVLSDDDYRSLQDALRNLYNLLG